MLTVPINKVIPCVGGFLKQASSMISNVIYIKLEPVCATISNGSITTSAHSSSSTSACSPSSSTLNRALNGRSNELLNVIPNIYRIASLRAPQHDVRVIIERVLKQLHFEPEVLLTNDVCHQRVRQLHDELSASCPVMAFEAHESSGDSNVACNLDVQLMVQSDDVLRYEHTCLGGTFDQLHNGHKVLLNEALVRTTKRLVIGVTDDSMLTNKVLCELIAPVSQRIESLNAYLTDVDDRIEFDIRPIHDPFGPSIEIPELQCLIVSEETLSGGNAVNKRREQRQMAPLDLFVTKLLSEHSKQIAVEEDKISSSSLRIRRLGTIIREPEPRPDLPVRPYLIGLTGGICAGKSTILQTLQQLGAGVINCDQLAHQTYAVPGSEVFNKIRDTFGADIVDASGSIDRKRLGELVFSDSAMLAKLNEIVWPATERLIQEQLQHLNAKHDVIVLEAALLLEANWDRKFHQVWVTIISEEEAICRLYERNRLQRDQAIQRIRSQLSNRERVARANVIFSSQWEVDVTQAQVHKAWKTLNQKYLNHVQSA